MNRRLIILLCIFSNLLLGNGIIYWWASSSASINWDLMIGMSLSCVLCYLFIFKYINFKSWNIIKLMFFSIFTCVVIELIGCSFASVVTGLKKEESDYFFDTLKGLGIGFFLGIMGNILMFPITITMGVLNLFWFRKFQKSLALEY
ncbi:hypothetical protein CLV62_101546 [Dysgonomonas alginatilytica]|uniref:Uncharacterized protein n=1 Tax=Dysgonomonas alginatilytica TaxID=1605892 RepID=A0A2V3PU87_9BACT|nr:hypothetical protein [Dysgonomonas alginatilytica]PXV69277.1 hypothetical protein CLV62_101546 [Dysgonomonas alginatilytica]